MSTSLKLRVKIARAKGDRLPGTGSRYDTRPADNPLTSDKIYYVNFLKNRQNRGPGTIAPSLGGILVEQFPHRRHDVNVLVGHPTQALRQEFRLFA